MKKFTSIFLAIVLLICASSCFAEEAIKEMPFASVVGYWYTNLTDEESLIELNPSGNISGASGNQKLSGKWKLDGEDLYINVDGNEEFVFTYNKEDSVFYDVADNYFLTRYTVSSYVAPEQVNVDDINQFNGNWSLYLINDFGNTLTAENFLGIMNMNDPWIYYEETDLNINIDNGKVKLFKNGTEVQFELANGQLIYDGTDSESSVPAAKISLTPMNTLVYESDDGLIMVFNPYLK